MESELSHAIIAIIVDRNQNERGPSAFSIVFHLPRARFTAGALHPTRLFCINYHPGDRLVNFYTGPSVKRAGDIGSIGRPLARVEGRNSFFR